MNFIFVLICAITLIYIIWATHEADFTFAFFTGILVFFVQCLFIVIVGISLWYFTGKPYEVNETYNIVSMEREMTIKGSFILGSGYIHSEPQYFCYVVVGDNEYKLYNFETERSSLVLSDTNTPHILGTHKYFEAKWMTKMFDGLKRDYHGSVYKFIVPTKTIVREFKG